MRVHGIQPLLHLISLKYTPTFVKGSFSFDRFCIPISCTYVFISIHSKLVLVTAMRYNELLFRSISQVPMEQIS